MMLELWILCLGLNCVALGLYMKSGDYFRSALYVAMIVMSLYWINVNL